MCYQVCIAFPFSSRFSKTKLNLQHLAKAAAVSWRHPSKTIIKKKSRARRHCGAFAWYMRVVLVWELQRNSFQHLFLNCWNVEPGVVYFWQKLCNKPTFLLEGFLLGENVTLAAGCLFCFLSPRPGISYSHSETKGMRRTAGVTLPWNKVDTGKFIQDCWWIEIVGEKD